MQGVILLQDRGKQDMTFGCLFCSRHMIYYILFAYLEEEMAEKKEVVIPDELLRVMEGSSEAKEFFESLTDGYKRGYCDWVGGAKGEATRQTRAEKALLMLLRKQKTLKT